MKKVSRIFLLIILVLAICVSCFSITFFAATPSTVDTFDATDMGKDRARMNGSLVSIGSSAVERYGFYYGTTSNPTTEATASAGIITSPIPSYSLLVRLTTRDFYYFRAYAKDYSGEVSLGPVKSFRTLVLSGDVNDDGTVTSADVTMIQQYVASAITLKAIDKVAADVNGDGNVSMMDVIYIQQYLAGITNICPIGQYI